MKRISKVVCTVATAIGVAGALNPAFAGNGDRAGQAGGTQLLINPWARNTGWGGANSASNKGLEAMFTNVAGTAFTKKTELIFAHTNWLGGTDISVNAFGFSQHVGATGVLGFSVMSLNMGDIEVTTEDNPEGGVGVYSPQFMNLGLSYAKGFSDNIYGGFTLKALTEGTADVKARGMAIDAGIQYVTGKYDHIKFGIALKNVGPKMRFSGDGLSFRTNLLSNGVNQTVEQRSAYFELPSLLNIGGSYDLYFSKDSATMKNHRVTLAGTFTSNSFTKDEFRFGVEYGFRNMLMLRGGYVYEDGILDYETRTTAFTGWCGGVTLEVPFGGNKSTFALDYSYRTTNPFNGVHTFGARVNL